jgi:hypothetical protein
VRGANLVELHPGLAWLLAAAPMPVFFAAAGWANATATRQSTAVRLRTLIGLGAVIVGCWTAAVIVAVTVTGSAGVVGKGARIATQPLWFVAAYAPMAAAGRPMATLAARRPAMVVGVCLGGLAVVDVARFGAGWPGWIGWPGFYLAWAVPWLLGGWWRDRFERGQFHERRAGIVLALVAGTVAVAVVEVAGYSPALIDAVPAARSNTTPPTLYTAIVGIAQVGILLAVAQPLDRVGRRWRTFWDRAGEAAVGVYLWHLTALALCAAAVALVLPAPRRLTGTWWATRPLWYSAVLAITVGLVRLTDLARTRLRRRRGIPGPPTRRRATVGVVLAATAAAAVGVRGPTSIARAFAWTALLVLTWAILRGDTTG